MFGESRVGSSNDLSTYKALEVSSGSVINKKAFGFSHHAKSRASRKADFHPGAQDRQHDGRSHQDRHDITSVTHF
ncbi:uncharacterized [Tachysurus ichikawai]